MTIQPRDPRSLSHVPLFDEGCVRSRLQELTSALISEFATEEMRKIADTAKRSFQPIPVCDWHPVELEQKYGEQAQSEAKKVLEQERQAYVDYIADYIKQNLTQIISRLRYLVWTVDENEKPCKLQHIIAKEMAADIRGNWDYREVEYVANHDVERLQQIRFMSHRLTAFRDYVPYFNKELKKLWQETTELTTLETVKKGETQNAKKA